MRRICVPFSIAWDLMIRQVFSVVVVVTVVYQVVGSSIRAGAILGTCLKGLFLINITPLAFLGVFRRLWYSPVHTRWDAATRKYCVLFVAFTAETSSMRLRRTCLMP